MHLTRNYIHHNSLHIPRLLLKSEHEIIIYNTLSLFVFALQPEVMGRVFLINIPSNTML